MTSCLNQNIKTFFCAIKVILSFDSSKKIRKMNYNQNLVLLFVVLFNDGYTSCTNQKKYTGQD